MSDHKSAIVPIEAWCYQSPDVRLAGNTIDVGLFAESLLYYDHVALNVGNTDHFVELVRWFLLNSDLPTFLSLFDEGLVQIYDYAFITSAIQVEQSGTYQLMNIQDQIQSEPNTFNRRYLYSQKIDELIPKARHRKRLYESLSGRAIEVKAADFGSPIENARQDYLDPKRNALILQSFVDEMYRLRGLGKPPEVAVHVTTSPDGSKHNINWNVDLNKISELAGKELGFHKGSPLVAGALTNRLLWSAAKLSADLYLSSPMSMLVGDKLYEASARTSKVNSVITDLKVAVEFPDIRGLVNQRVLPFGEVLKIRRKAKRFRDWVQLETERDRDAIIAYHHEVARESGLKSTGRASLTIFGILGGSLGGAIIGEKIAGVSGQTMGSVFGASLGYLTDLAAKLGTDWKPVVFGDWLRHRIAKFTGNE
jgi:hypothetical protein